jgi:choline dehydrogenase-like flavoprotein
MTLEDLRGLGEPRSIQTDLCIVGSGPAGTSIAKEFAGSKIQVLLVESGGAEQTQANQDLYDFENLGVARYPAQDLPRNRILGGTSHTWSGRCAAFDDIDFERRTWVPNSGWPIGPTEVRPFLDRAGGYLGNGPNVYDDHLWEKLGVAPPRPLIDPVLLKPQFWQISEDGRNPGEPARFSRTLASIDAPNVRVLTHANLTHVNTSADGTRVESLEISTLEGKRFEIKTRIAILACGGIENARLLLASNRIVPNGVGNAHDLVGRFLMDHPRCALGWFEPGRSAGIQDRFGGYSLDDENGRHLYFHGLALSPELQRKEQLLNCAAFLSPVPSADDPWSAMKMLLGRADPNLTTAELERAGNSRKQIATVIRHLPGLLNNVYRRIVKRRTSIVRAQEIVLSCWAEQAPDASSRVTLAERTDTLGMPLSRIDWRLGELERRSVQRFGELIGLELRRIGLPEHSPNTGLGKDVDWRSSFIDSAHPIGTTRMSDSSKQGVVDRNCQVHGVSGLYIAGSSVFPTSGHASPTLMIVALAIRLADWLKFNEFSKPQAVVQGVDEVGKR